MAKILTNISAREKFPTLSKDQQLWLYNALDCCVTHEVLQNQLPLLTPTTQGIYDFALDLRAPLVEAMLRGIQINLGLRDKAIKVLSDQLTFLQTNFDKLACEVWGKPINYDSPKQLQTVFYKIMKLPEQLAYRKGKGRTLTTDRKALEKLQTLDISAAFLINHILALRELSGLISVLKKGLHSDSRMRFSLNIGGTNTGRLSSSADAWGLGTNGQNITEPLRQIFIADPGQKLGYADLEQAESRATGLYAYLATGIRTYLDACESGDLHTTVATMTWPELKWSKDPAENRVISDQPFYRDLTRRDACKRLGHGSNYYGTHRTLAAETRIPFDIVREFQHRYFTSFPEIRQWHSWVAEQLQTKGYLTTVLGRRRQFFDWPHEDSTLRAAIAFLPQSTVGDALNKGLLRLWSNHRQEIQILLQVHDAILFQYPDNPATEPQILANVKTSMEFPISDTVIPSEVAVGWNWGKYRDKPKKNYLTKTNPDGLKTWKGSDDRVRKTPAQVGPLDYIVY